MIAIDYSLSPDQLLRRILRMWDFSADKIRQIELTFPASAGAPVFTCRGRYTARGWTEWTQGFQWGSALLQYDATGEKDFLCLGKERTRLLMAPHLTHMGVHDHGFNNVSTFGNLWRLGIEGNHDIQENDLLLCELALKCSGAVQARRWTTLNESMGYIYSFNGPHSLFADTIRSLRALALAHQLGHVLMEENDRRISLLGRLIQHARTTATYSTYYGEGRDCYDVRGRVAHESIFNVNDGNYRCPNSQQGYSPFTTWTRGLAWLMCGFSELLEFIDSLEESELNEAGGKQPIEAFMLKAARACCDFYIQQTPTDGIPYWDTGAPLLYQMGDYLNRPANPFNDYEPVDSSAAAIAAQGLLRLGHYLGQKGMVEEGDRYGRCGLTVLNHLLEEPYLSTSGQHQGLLLHSVYHRPNGWDFIPAGAKIPYGESSMWGDYHLREAALYVQRLAQAKRYLVFFAKP
jgi:unsaturated chondroitin disaccharide hydrolase